MLKVVAVDGSLPSADATIIEEKHADSSKFDDVSANYEF